MVLPSRDLPFQMMRGACGLWRASAEYLLVKSFEDFGVKVCLPLPWLLLMLIRYQACPAIIGWTMSTAKSATTARLYSQLGVENIIVGYAVCPFYYILPPFALIHES
jgi:hypothetical protein